jgi:probable HAF family extracellular repeat protein
LSGSRKAEVEGLGNNRVAVGTHGLGRDQRPAALVWKPDGQRVELAPDARLSYGTVIRSDGTAYGMLQPRGGGHSHPFRWRAGELTLLPYVAGWAWTKPNAANKALQVAGTGQSVPQDGQCPSEPLLFTDGSWLRLGSLGGDCGGANAINDFGVVVGFTTREGSDAGHAFVWEGGVMTDLGSLGGGYATANDINADGVIVGYSADANLDPHAVVWRDGAITALDKVVDPLPDGTMVEAIAVNGYGQILVIGVGDDTRFHTWRLDPL